MFTVLIAEKEHISSIENYKIFLKPYLNDHFGLCEWIPGEETLSRAVPTLEKTVSPYRQWRAVILCEEEGLLLRNPFEVVTCNCPVRPEYADEETLTAYLQAVRKEKCRAYDEASKKPLVRLVTRLCEEPLAVSENRKDPARQDTQDAEPVEGTMVRKMDLEFDEYWYEAQYKNQLRQQILGEERINFYYPAEVICIAKRTHEEEAYAVASAWATHDVSQYRRFYDWNMYYDKMRYVAYDILPRNHTQYPTEYLKFLATVLLIAGHELPPDALRPHFVYGLGHGMAAHHQHTGAPEQIAAHVDAVLVLLRHRVIEEQRQIEHGANGGIARIIDHAAVMRRLLHIHRRITTPRSGDISKGSFHYHTSNI